MGNSISDVALLFGYFGLLVGLHLHVCIKLVQIRSNLNYIVATPLWS